MLSSKGFDEWADGYDKSVDLTEKADAYPFAGYEEVLAEIYNPVCSKNHAAILDIGFGTGVLTKKLYDAGNLIYGIDFSERMIEIAKEKMPNAILKKYDFSNGLPQEFKDKQFDSIISTYAFHHLTDKFKVEFINQLLAHLSSDGMILIGDVIFKTRAQLNDCRIKSGRSWDASENYIVFDELKKYFEKTKIRFSQVSHCAGVITIAF